MIISHSRENWPRRGEELLGVKMEDSIKEGRNFFFLFFFNIIYVCIYTVYSFGPCDLSTV